MKLLLTSAGDHEPEHSSRPRWSSSAGRSRSARRSSTPPRAIRSGPARSSRGTSSPASSPRPRWPSSAGSPSASSSRTALPSIPRTVWLPWVEEADVAARERRRHDLPRPLDARVGAGCAPPVARPRVRRPERREPGHVARGRGCLRVVDEPRRGRGARVRRLRDLSAPRQPRPAGEHHGRRGALGGWPDTGPATRSTTRRRSRWSMASSRWSRRGAGGCSPRSGSNLDQARVARCMNIQR